MKRFALFVMLIALFSFCASTLADNEKKEDKTDEEKPQTQPTKTYELKPTFLKKMKWKEKVKLTVDPEWVSRSNRYYALTTNLEICDLKNNKPSSVKFIKLNGELTSERIYEEKVSTTKTKIEEMSFSANLDENFCLKSIPKGFDTNKVMDFMKYYPTGNIAGFMPPENPVKIGDTWKSNELLPLNWDLLADYSRAKLVKTNYTGEFKLKSVESKNKVETATLTWKGKCKARLEEFEDDPVKFNWNVTIMFDITNKRLLSTEGTTTLTDIGLNTPYLTIKVTRTLEYSKEKVKEKEPKITPKTDDE